jgi:hypothetical protein
MEQAMTYQELLAALSALTPAQLAQPVVWSGDERGGKVSRVWIAEEDWIDYDGDCSPRSEIAKADPDAAGPAAHVYIPTGTVHLVVDE